MEGAPIYSPDPSLSYRDFRQACRAFKPSALIPALAHLSASIGEPPYGRAVTHGLPPWGIAAAARESLLHGNEHRDKKPDEHAIRNLLHKFQIAVDLPPIEGEGVDFLHTLTTQMSYEQFPWQESMYEELARSHAWLIEGLSDVETKVISEESLNDIVGGIALRDAIGATFFLQVGALQNGGIYDPGWLDQPNFADVLALYPRANIETIAARITATPESYRKEFEQNSLRTPILDRYDYNPLARTPFIELGDGIPVAPATRLIMRTVTPGGLYYAGMAKYGQSFARDLGDLFEHYVGRQLRLLPSVEVHPEIRYGKGGGQKSIDWFVVMPNLVILVEAKSKRLGPAARAAGPTLHEALAGSLQQARAQLTRTCSALASRMGAFAHIPTDRPMLALIVTAEPFYTGSAYLLDHAGATIPGEGSFPDVPVAVSSAREIEWLVTHGSDVQELLLDRLARRGDGVVALRDIARHPDVQNPILENAWNSYPWPRRGEVTALNE